jgi:hypothetical protein
MLIRFRNWIEGAELFMRSTYSSDKLRLIAAATATLAFAAVLTPTQSAWAQAAGGEDATKACVTAYESAQEHRKAEQLLKARQELRLCAAPSCPAMIQTDCMNWLGQVVDTLPSVVFSAKRGDENVFDVSVSVDGQPGVTQLDGKPVEIDPGLHTFVFERPGAPAIEKKLIVAAREKAQVVAVGWEAPAAAAPPPPTAPEASVEKERPVPPLFWVFGATTVIGFGGFAGFGLAAQSTRHNLETSCSPRCSDSQVAPLKTQALLADVGVGVGAASAVGALIVFLARPERDKPRSVGISSFGVAPAAAGLTLQCAGSF